MLKIRIVNGKSNDGRIRLIDLALLAGGLQRAVTAQLHRSLGFGYAARSIKAATLADLELTGLEKGSTILVCESAAGNASPAANRAISFGAKSLRNGIDAARATGETTGVAPAAVRALQASLAPIVNAGAVVHVFAPGEQGELIIDAAALARLQPPDDDDEIDHVDVCGKVSQMNDDNKAIWVSFGKRHKVRLNIGADVFDKIDRELRWANANIVARPKADNRKKLVVLRPEDVTRADDGAQQRMQQVSKAESRAADGPAKATLERIASFAALDRNWNEYGAERISKQARALACQFAVRIQLMVERNDWALPPPFVVPTPRGGVQLEWDVEGRGVELEFTKASTIAILRAGEVHQELDMADDWDVFAALHWVALGVDP